MGNDLGAVVECSVNKRREGDALRDAMRNDLGTAVKNNRPVWRRSCNHRGESDGAHRWLSHRGALVNVE